MLRTTSNQPNVCAALHLLQLFFAVTIEEGRWGFLVAEGCGAGVMARHNALARFTTSSSFLRRSPRAPPTCWTRNAELAASHLPTAAASWPSLWSVIQGAQSAWAQLQLHAKALRHHAPCCGIWSMWSLSVLSVPCLYSCGVPLSLCSVSRPDCYALVKGNNLARRVMTATSLSDTDRGSTHNARLALLLTLIYCQGNKSSPFSRSSMLVVMPSYS